MMFSALLFALPLQAVAAPALAAIDHAALDAVVAEYEGEDRPGFTAALCRDGEIVWSNACGEASLEWGVPNDRQTVYRLASTSKQFTAAAVHLLALDGALDLDAPLVQYVPEFSALSPMPTVRQMMHHTSGMRDYLNLMSLMGYDFNDTFDLEEVLEVLLLQKGLSFDPGTDWSYSNSNYVLLAEIVERVSGTTLAAFTQERLFDPLGMKSTQWLDDVDRVIEHRAWGYEPAEEGFRRSTTRIEILGDGALASNVIDLAQWAEVLVDPPEAWAPFVAAMLDGPTIDGDENDRYAGGLMIDTFRGLKHISHGGAFVGFRAQMAHLPDQNLTAICLSNDGSFDPDSITNNLFAAALGDDLPPYVAPVRSQEEATEATTPEERKERRAQRKAQRRAPSEEEIALMVGDYVAPELRMAFEIALDEKGRLEVRDPDGETSRLLCRRESGEAITHASSFGLRVEFEWDAKGRLTGGTLNDGRANGMRFERALEDADSTK